MSTVRKVRVAVIGCGVIGPLHLRCYAHNPAAEIAAVLRGAPLTAELMCRLTTSAYIAGIKTGRVIAQTAAGQGA